MDAENFNFQVIMHHVQHLVMYSLLLWQGAFASRFILKWAGKYLKFSMPGVSHERSIAVQPAAAGTKSTAIDIESFIDTKPTIPEAVVGTTSIHSETQKVKDTGTKTAKKLKQLRSKR